MAANQPAYVRFAGLAEGPLHGCVGACGAADATKRTPIQSMFCGCCYHVPDPVGELFFLAPQDLVGEEGVLLSVKRLAGAV